MKHTLKDQSITMEEHNSNNCVSTLYNDSTVWQMTLQLVQRSVASMSDDDPPPTELLRPAEAPGVWLCGILVVELPRLSVCDSLQSHSEGFAAGSRC